MAINPADYGIIFAKEQYLKRGGFEAALSSERTYRRRFLVKTTGLGVAGALIEDYFADAWGQGEDVPWLTDPYTTGVIPSALAEPEDDGEEEAGGAGEEGPRPSETDKDAICVRVRGEPVDDEGEFWYVDFEYSNNPPINPDEYLVDPPGRQVEIDEGGTVYTKAMQQDLNGLLLANGAGDPFDPPAEAEWSYRVMTLTRWEKPDPSGTGIGYNRVFSTVYENTVNILPWQGFGVGAVKCKSVTAARKWIDGGYYWQVKRVFHIRDDGWQYAPLNCGFRYRPTPGAAPVDFLRGGVKPQKPILLRADGTLLNGTGSPGAEAPVFFNGIGGNPAPFALYSGVDFNAIKPPLAIPD